MWDALKFGPPGIAALALFWTVPLFKQELNRNTIRPSAQKLIVIFMVFSGVMTAAGCALAIFDDSMKSTRDAQLVGRLAEIRSTMSALDQGILSKYNVEMTAPDRDQRTTDLLKPIIRTMCDSMQSVYEKADGVGKLPNCKSLQGL